MIVPLASRCLVYLQGFDGMFTVTYGWRAAEIEDMEVGDVTFSMRIRARGYSCKEGGLSSEKPAGVQRWRCPGYFRIYDDGEIAEACDD